jgi:hypothetical protein
VHRTTKFSMTNEIVTQCNYGDSAPMRECDAKSANGCVRGEIYVRRAEVRARDRFAFGQLGFTGGV